MVELNLREKRDFLLNSYIEKYGSFYTKETLKNIEANFSLDFRKVQTDNVLAQIYAALDILPQNRNVYLAYLYYIRKYGLSNLNLVETHEGYFPALAKYINNDQTKMNKGSISIYSPNSVIESLGNIKIFKKKFTEDTDISMYDAGVIIKPCQDTEFVINKFNKAKKEFMIALCGCAYFSDNYDDSFTSFEEWFKYICDIAKSKDNELYIEYLPHMYKESYPILILKNKSN